jgi:hypothetical protein
MRILLLADLHGGRKVSGRPGGALLGGNNGRIALSAGIL